MTILPLLYLGNTEYYSALLSGQDVVIDLGEHYVKQSYRNRCEILTAGGVAGLTVNVVKGGSMKKRPVRDMRVDYSKRWQHQHFLSLLSAYRNSPYFEHYREYFEPFYEKRYEFLADLNIELLELTFRLLRSAVRPRFSDIYIESGPFDRDMRESFEPLVRSGNGTVSRPGNIAATPYYQVFGDRFPFIDNLSIVDLLFCEGPAAKDSLTLLATP